MISTLLSAFEKGLNVMRLNTRLLLVGVLVFVFPILFVWVTQSFYVTAYNNIDTVEKLRISALHDALAISLKHSQPTGTLVTELATVYANENQDITKIRIVDNQDDNFIIINSLDTSQIGEPEKSDELYRSLPFSEEQGSLITKTVVDGVRTWQVFRKVTLGDNELFIFTEHSFAVIDSIMAARKQQSYFGLGAIFLFLITLAYWLNKQGSWEKEHAKLVKQLEERDLFSNMIAHEFRSPLTAIKGYASFLEESETLSKDEKRFAGNIHKSAERLVVLVSDFLEVARLQSGKLKVDKTEVDMRQILGQITEDLHSMATDKGLKLIYSKPEEPVLVQTDLGRMTQVLTNMVINAVKYTDKGKVELECTLIPGEMIVKIKDTGTGISAEDQQKLFAPFTRVGGVDASKTTGTGLGMWITKQLVDLLDGTIGVESIEGIGTHIVISFRT